MSKRKEQEVNEHNMRMIHKHWGKLMQRLYVEDVIHQLIQAGAITLDKGMEIISKKSNKDQVKDLLSCLLKKPNSLPLFIKVLEDSEGYDDLAKDLNIREQVPNIPSDAVTENIDNEADDNQYAAAFISNVKDRRRGELEAIANSVHKTYEPILKENTEQLKENTEQLKENSEQLKENTKQIREMTAFLAECRAEIKHLTERYEKLCKEYDSLQKNANVDETKLKQMEIEYENLLKENQELSKQLDNLNLDHSVREEIEMKLRQARASNETIQKECEDLMKEKNRLMNEKKNLERMLENAKGKSEPEKYVEKDLRKKGKRMDKIDDLIGKLVLRNKEIDRLRAENKELERLRRMHRR